MSDWACVCVCVSGLCVFPPAVFCCGSFVPVLWWVSALRRGDAHLWRSAHLLSESCSSFSTLVSCSMYSVLTVYCSNQQTARVCLNTAVHRPWGGPWCSAAGSVPAARQRCGVGRYGLWDGKSSGTPAVTREGCGARPGEHAVQWQVRHMTSNTSCWLSLSLFVFFSLIDLWLVWSNV